MSQPVASSPPPSRKPTSSSIPDDFVIPGSARRLSFGELVMRDPLVPFGVGLTTVILLMGVTNLVRGGNPHRAQLLMRARVAAQAGTVLALAYGSYKTYELKHRNDNKTA